MHPVAKATESACQRGYLGATHRRIIPSRKLPHFDVEVSKQSLDRAIAFLSKLAFALECDGFRFEKPTSESLRYQLLHMPTGMFVELRIMEPARGRTHGLTEEEKESVKWSSSKKVLRPTGRLQVEIGYRSYLPEQVWRENSTRKLDDMLPDIILGCKAAGEAALVFKIQCAEQEKRWKEESLRREREEKRRAAEQVLRDTFTKEAGNWRKAQQMREFLAACETSLRHTGADVTPNGSAQKWLHWASGIIESIDPICRGYPESAVKAAFENSEST